MFPELTNIQLWVLSNSAGAMAFAVATGVVFLSECRHRALRILGLACGANMLWFVILAAAPVFNIGGPALDFAETIRTCTWLWLVAALLPPLDNATAERTLRRVAQWAPLALAVYLAWRLASAGIVGPPTEGHSFLFAAGAAFMSVLGLILTEQAWRTGDADRRWAMKYLCLALTVMFGYDFLMFSFALVYAHIDIAIWGARGAVNALAAPMVAIAAMRNASWAPRMGMSRRAVFRSGTVLVVGGYLLAVAVGSYYIRRFGGNWASFSAVLFVAATMAGLAVLLLSAQVRAHARVLVNKHLFRYKYDYREEWLALTRQLSHVEAGVDAYERAIHAVAQLMESPAGALWLDRDSVLACVASWNMPSAAEIEEPADSRFVVFLRESGWIVDLEAAHDRTMATAGVEIPASVATLARARLLLPLFAEDRLLGFMILAEPRAHDSLGWEELDLLKTLGQQVGVFLDQQESAQALTQARQFEAFNQLTAFLMHDLKNIAGQQSLVLQNAERHRHNPEFIDDMLLTVDNSVSRMQQVLAQLERVSREALPRERVAVDGVVDALCAELATSRPAPVRHGPSSEAVVHVDRERLTMVLRHIIRNAQDATADSGRVQIETAVVDGQVEIVVRDDGEGMSAAFIRESLFKPFVSTKSTRGMGIGAYQARDFARTSGGNVSVESDQGVGTAFKLRLPLAETQGA